MAPAGLNGDGMTRPPRSRRHRLMLGVLLLVVCLALLPLMILATVRAWTTAGAVAGIGTTLCAVILAEGVVVGVVGIVRAVSSTAERTSDRAPTGSTSASGPKAPDDTATGDGPDRRSTLC